MAVLFSPFGNSQYFDENGDPAVGFTVETFAAGSSTPLATYTSATGLVANAASVTLNAAGLNPAGQFWLTSGLAYKFIVKDAGGVTVQTVDGVTGVNDPAVISTSDQWLAYSGTPTYINATSFSVAGDQTSTLQVGRRLKTTNSGGTIYSTISVSSFGAGITTVTVVNDSGTLDSGLSAVSYGLLSYSNTSVPRRTGELIGVQTFTVSGTYTPSFGTNSVIVEVQAPGGGSGGCINTAVGQWAAGRPGGGGGYGLKRITSAFSGVTVTIGAAGTAGATGNNAGGDGGTTSFGALLSCTGGTGGAGSGAIQTTAGFPGTSGAASAAAGGVATGADYHRPGSPGGLSFAVSVSAAVRGNGGDAFYGSGGAGGYVGGAQGVGVAGSGYGGGASATANVNAVASTAGGQAGAPGIVIVREYA